MSTSNRAGIDRHQTRANPAGMYVAIVGALILNAAVFLDWATSRDLPDGLTGYEADSLWPFAAYLGAGFAVALVMAWARADRRQHRGLSLASMAVAIAVVLQIGAWLIDIPGVADRADQWDGDIGAWVAMLGAILWAVGSGFLAREPEGDDPIDRVDTVDVRDRTAFSAGNEATPRQGQVPTTGDSSAWVPRDTSL